MTLDKSILKGSLLGRVKAAEETLAKEDAKALETALPEGHPLRAEVEKQKALLGGDLSGLPPGHPLFRMLEASRQVYERRAVEKESQELKEEAVKIRRAKRIEEIKARKEKIADNDSKSEMRRNAAKTVNKCVDDVIGSIRDAWKVMADSEEIFNNDPYDRIKVVKMRNLLSAVERGLLDNRFNRI